MIPCYEARLLWNEFASGELGERDSDAVRTHLAECPDCATEFERHRIRTARIRAALAPLKPPAAAPVRRSRPIPLYLHGVAALLLVGLAFWLTTPRDSWILETGAGRRDVPWQVAVAPSTPAILRFGSAVRAELEPGSLLVPESGEEVRLERGRARFRVASGKPLRVVTPSVEIHVRGTEFLVDIEGKEPVMNPAAAAGVFVAVISGSVLVANLAREETLGPGDTLQATASGGWMRSPLPAEIAQLEQRIEEIKKENQRETERRAEGSRKDRTSGLSERRKAIFEERAEDLKGEEKLLARMLVLDPEQSREMFLSSSRSAISNALDRLRDSGALVSLPPPAFESMRTFLTHRLSEATALEFSAFGAASISRYDALPSEEALRQLRNDLRREQSDISDAAFLEVQSRFGEKARSAVQQGLRETFGSSIGGDFQDRLGGIGADIRADLEAACRETEPWPPVQSFLQACLPSSEIAQIEVRLRELGLRIDESRRDDYVRILEEQISELHSWNRLGARLVVISRELR